jgi:hypothetical protein
VRRNVDGEMAVRMVSDGDISEGGGETCPLDVVAGVNGAASSVGRISELSALQGSRAV